MKCTVESREVEVIAGNEVGRHREQLEIGCRERRCPVGKGEIAVRVTPGTAFVGIPAAFERACYICGGRDPRAHDLLIDLGHPEGPSRMSSVSCKPHGHCLPLIGESEQICHRVLEHDEQPTP